MPPSMEVAEMKWLGLAMAWVLAGCAASAPPAPVGETIRPRCGELPIVFTATGDTARLAIGERSYTMQLTPAASGARFVANEDPATVFWNKGDGGLLEWHGQRLPACRTEAAPFRAGGNEPSWSLRFEDGRMRFDTLDESWRFDLPLPTPAVLPGERRYTATAGRQTATVEVADRLCRDNMSGMPHPQSVTVTIGERRYAGCGGAPADLLRGRDWRIVRVDGRDLAADAGATLAFGADGRAGGETGCNRFFATWRLTGESLAFVGLGSTRKACAAPLMEQEQRLLAALDRVRAFDFGPDGSLRLLDGKGVAVEARAPGAQ
jgi:heat shock protein HslJ/membrane-bound inhibitor of C-type lysozyme